MFFRHRVRAERILDLPVQPRGTEVGVIHEVSERIGRNGLGMDLFKHIVFR